MNRLGPISFRTAIVFCLASILPPVLSSADDRRVEEALPAESNGNVGRPNVLFLISDDLNCRLGCYGDPHVQTPNLDRLAARGVRFENAYCQFPLCGPSRNSMLCGLYPDSTGILANAQIFRQTIPHHQSLPHAFRLNGYFAARIGKLYHYNVPRSVGTNGHDDPASWEMEINPMGCDRSIEEPDIFSLRKGSFGGTLSWYASPRSDELHTDAMLAEEADWVLERCARRNDRPFFLAVGFYRPHTPYVAPKKYFESYDLEDMPIVDDVEEDLADVPAAGLLSQKAEQSLLTDRLSREAIQAYYASITFMDAQVGKVLDALDHHGLADNTIIVFTSDHGYHLGAKGLWQKMSLFEESARVPLIIADPKTSNAGETAITPVGLIDLYPTLADLCGVKTPAGLQGQSLRPILSDVDEPGRGFTISQVTRKTKGQKSRFFGYTIRTPRYRLTLWDEGQAGVELYDHEADPLEKHNLAFDGDQADSMTRDREVLDVIAELSKTLRDEISRGIPETGRPEVSGKGWVIDLTNP
ncbi:sulfatase [Aporhodopirellula aestuarii]|uniref:Sulfatase n=1 Tax=Aporhodopirellula aestuarii TaxID=2950107 RepID=A0ABT0U527_9BACT|nr:sulfatase [Aporhodopirellula aestuarii]MCM2371665.1 sulfatase [Aporhodopirellula aestuarii]